MAEEKTEDLDHSAAPLIEHLIELRSRLIWCIVYLAVGFLIAFQFGQQIYDFLSVPFLKTALKYGQSPEMIAISGQEPFLVQVKVALFTSFLATFPMVSMQLWKFVAPGLYKNERRAFLPFLIGTPVLFTLGAALAYYLVIPLAWDFFMSFQVAADTGATPTHVSITVLPSVKEYWSLTLMLIIAFGLSFQLPILLLLLARVGIVTAKGLSKVRKYVVVAAFAFAAVMTPPDLVSQILLGVPILFLYEMSIIAIRLTIKDKENV